jgi:hypothetical protein
VIGVVAVAALAGALALVALTRSPGPPSAPGPVVAEASTCGEPCRTLAPSVTLDWPTPISGSDPTGYLVLRDGSQIEAIGSSERTYTDTTVTMGSTHEYQVVAVSEDGNSVPTVSVEATVPMPPPGAAHLHGVYRVRLTVRSARSIGSAFGIKSPMPGKRRRDRWSFESTCEQDVGICSSSWLGLEGEIAPRGTLWRGTVDGLPARCDGRERAPAPIDLKLKSQDAILLEGSAWTVTRFRGKASVTFRCKGFPRASATVSVTGRL